MENTQEIVLAEVRPKVLALTRKFFRASRLDGDPEDVVQDVLIRLWEARRSGADIRNPEAWAVTVHAITTVKRAMRSQIIVNDNGKIIMKTDSLMAKSGVNDFSSGTVQNTVYIVDGKVVEESEVKNLPAKQIQSITVVKDSESLKQFNLDGSSSVVNIITKSEESAKELLKSLPGAKVEEDGTVTINGQSVKKSPSMAAITKYPSLPLPLSRETELVNIHYFTQILLRVLRRRICVSANHRASCISQRGGKGG